MSEEPLTQWELFDRIAKSEKVSFIPDWVPSLQTWGDHEGHRRMLINIEGVSCYLTEGVPNRVEQPFYDQYCQAYRQMYENTPELPLIPEVDRDGYTTWLVETAKDHTEEEKNAS